MKEKYDYIDIDEWKAMGKIYNTMILMASPLLDRLSGTRKEAHIRFFKAVMEAKESYDDLSKIIMRNE